jgi:hypothetical protein
MLSERRRPRISTNTARVAVTVVAAAGLIAATVAIALTRSHHGPKSTGCRITSASTTYALDLEQAANATTVAAVGKRMGMPDHAVTVALAAALQESRLRNLAYGDRDSRGIFQQRPSQGWGTPAQVMTPRHAAAAFFQHLTQVAGWQSLPVTDAAQRVQLSGSPAAYARWEPEARALARAATGEVSAAFSCSASTLAPGAATAPLQQTMTQELGLASLRGALAPSRGWTVATWLVGHATRFGITSVGFAGQQWTPLTGRWQSQGALDGRVQISRVAGGAVP